MSTVAEVRAALCLAGFSPIPVNGKRPAPSAWEQKTITNPAEIALWDKVFPDAINTGILTKLTPTLDIDILNPDAATAVEELARERFEERGFVLVRIGKAPKRAIPFRTDAPFKKIVRNLVSPSSSEQNPEKLELLADGQQVVVFGTHKDTGKPYSWHGGEPGKIRWEDIPHISAVEAQALIHDAERLLIKEFGYNAVAQRPKEQVNDDAAGAAGSAGSRDWVWLVSNILKGHELHDAICAVAAKLVASGMADGAAVNLIRGWMESSSAPRDDRWQERFDDIPRAVSTAREKFGDTATPQADTGEKPDQLLPLPYINMSNWDDEPIPEQEWGVLNRFPLRQTAVFSGEGAGGKSTLALQLGVAHVLGRDWLGSMPELGPAIVIDAEDDTDVMHRRLANIRDHYRATSINPDEEISFKRLIQDGLHPVSLVNEDATLAAASRSGKIEPTALYKRLLKDAGEIRPKLISIASSANVYAGNEIDRSQVQQFASLLTRLAIAGGGYVILIAHPSLTGITSDTGLSGTTQWHNAVRARCYLKSIKPEAGEQPDNDLRELVFKKNQYGRIEDSVALRYQNGLYLPVPGMASLDKAAHDARADEVFLDLLRRFTKENRFVGSAKSAIYAPSVFAKEDEAKRGGVTSKALENAMARLFKSGKIWNDNHGRPSRPRYHLALKS